MERNPNDPKDEAYIRPSQPRFGSPSASKLVICIYRHCLMTVPLTINETLKIKTLIGSLGLAFLLLLSLSQFVFLMQESFWW